MCSDDEVSEFFVWLAVRYTHAARCLQAARATLFQPPPPPAPLEAREDFLDLLTAELVAYRRQFDGLRDKYRSAMAAWLEQGEQRRSRRLDTKRGSYVAARLRPHGRAG